MFTNNTVGGSVSMTANSGGLPHSSNTVKGSLTIQ